MNNDKFNVMDMANAAYASMPDESDISELFKQDTPVENSQAPATPSNDESKVNKGEKKPWTPDPSLLEGMDELNSAGPIYDKKEIEDKITEANSDLQNISDSEAKKDADEVKGDMERKLLNIEEAKARHGISKFQIPTETLIGGQYEASIFSAAGDTNHDRAQEGLDQIFNEIEKLHPDFILERVVKVSSEENKPISKEIPKTDNNIIEIPSNDDNTESNNIDDDIYSNDDPSSVDNLETGSTDDLKIIIDKRDVSNLSFNTEDIEKIKKSRTVELNIVEGKDLEMSSIENISSKSAIDLALAPYIRKSNDIVAALPASKYRASFTGLSYVDMIDLSNSQELNTIDGEKKKWTIAYQHIKNPSIGPWKEYRYYIDSHGNKVILDSDDLPDGVSEDDVTYVSKFEDFLMKTSYIDIDYILWKILCATTMDKEIVTIDCHHRNVDGTYCNNSYDWIYNPSELINMDSISAQVLEELKATTEASSADEIKNIYNTSLVHDTNTVKLSSSGMYAIYGHLSAYDYINNVYGRISELERATKNNDSVADPTLVSNLFKLNALPSIKGFLIPKADGNGYFRVTGVDNIINVIDQLDEIDCSIIDKIATIATEPYQFEFSIRDIICPKCGHKSSINIDNLTTLLFIVARSLANVEVVLKTQ